VDKEGRSIVHTLSKTDTGADEFTMLRFILKWASTEDLCVEDNLGKTPLDYGMAIRKEGGKTFRKPNAPRELQALTENADTARARTLIDFESVRDYTVPLFSFFIAVRAWTHISSNSARCHPKTTFTWHLYSFGYMTH
jgi:hypothetical protein